MVFVILVFSFTILMSSTNSLLLEPQERCVPTATAYGACHICVCHVDGVYHCRARTCQEKSHNSIEEIKKECEPKRTYREDLVFCTCSDGGFWKSDVCRNIFQHMKPKTNHPSQKLRTNVACKPHTFILLDCNICECSSNGHIELASCTNRLCKKGHKVDACSYGDILRTDNEVCSCSDIDLYIDRLCFKVTDKLVQEIKRSDIETIVDIGKTWMRTNVNKNECPPHTVLRIDCNKCVCSASGVLACTDKHCLAPKQDLLRSKQRNDFYALPELKSRNSPCEPTKQYRHKCNSCVCSFRGIPSCTTMICLNDIILDRRMLEYEFINAHKAPNVTEDRY